MRNVQRVAKQAIGIFESRTRWQERQGNQHPQPRDISAAYTNVCDSPNQ
jgi:hypothetical protein